MEDFVKKVTKTRKTRRIIRETSFGFIQDKLKYNLVYQGNGKAPDKRYDKNVKGLCLFISSKGVKTFYAFKNLKMYNQKKGKTVTNVSYKKMFNFADVQGFKYVDAKEQLKEILDSMTDSLVPKDQEKLFGHYCKPTPFSIILPTGFTNALPTFRKRYSKYCIITNTNRKMESLLN